MSLLLLELRRDGALLPGPRPVSDWHDGHLSTVLVDVANGPMERAMVLEVVGSQAPGQGLVLRLFDPHLARVTDRGMVFRGFQRSGPAAVLQEWELRLLPRDWGDYVPGKGPVNHSGEPITRID